MITLISKAVGIFFLLTILFNSLSSNTHAQSQEETLEGRVTQVVQQEVRTVDDFQYTYQQLKVDITRGSLQGNSLVIENGQIPTSDNQVYSLGDHLVITRSPDYQGYDTFYISGYVRRGQLVLLFLIFATLTIIIGKVRGALSLVGMGFSFIVIIKFILPRIISGQDAVTTAIIGSSFIIPVTFGLSHGFNRKTLIAAIGTIITLVITGVLSIIFVNITHLTGYAAEESGFLTFELGNRLDMKGILLAGIIIATLGILDDITISQSSIVAELKSANPKLKYYQLFTRAMNVGRDHISSLVNTLVLVYTGASLPLMLLFTYHPHPIAEVINYEIIADEIVRTLVGSIGLILAVPITTFLAALYVSRKQPS